MFSIVSGGRQTASIVLNPELLSDLGDEMDDFKYAVGKATGVALGWGLDDKEYLLRFLIDEHIECEADGFTINVTDREATVGARCKWGLANAFYWMLGKYLHARWWWPGESGEVITKADRFELPDGFQAITPSFSWRHLGPGGAVWDHLSVEDMERELGVSREWQNEVARWARRNLLSRQRTMDGHQQNNLIDPRKFGKVAAEYFALVGGVRQSTYHNGKHGNQLCTSNSDLIDCVASQVHDIFASSDVAILSISPNDGGGFCECPKCSEEDDTHADYDNEEDDDFREGPAALPRRFISRRIFVYANKVAERVGKSFPGKLLLLLIYGPYRKPPKGIQLQPNIIAQFCCQSSLYGRECIFQRDLDLAKALAGKARHFGIYEYYDQGMWPGTIRLFPALIEKSIKTYHRLGYRYYSPQAGYGFGVNPLNLIVMCRCLWNADESAEAIVKELCDSMFGPASGIVNSYFDQWCSHWMRVSSINEVDSSTTQSLGGSFRNLSSIYSREFLASRMKELDRALEAVNSSPVYSRRILVLREGLLFTRDLAEIAHYYVDHNIEEILSNFSSGTVATPEVHARSRQILVTLVAKWQANEEMVERVKNGPILSYFWVRYNRDKRGFSHPIHRAKAVLKALDQRSSAKSLHERC